jgi:coenzyme F420-0:L-glutamate ligase / coenzyme F420-1:gamma-L-glutamate ligase
VIAIIPVPGLPEVEPGFDLAPAIVGALEAARAGQPGWRGEAPAGRAGLEAGDVLVVTSKIVSKAEGRLVELEGVVPSALAVQWAAEHEKDARHVEVVLRETRRIVRMDQGVLIAETRHGFICANAGVDASNSGAPGRLLLLPLDPDASARGLRQAVQRQTGIEVAVVISDTFGRPWRTGQTNVAIGCAGIAPLHGYHGEIDPDGRRLSATSIAVVDELAGAAELVMGKLDRVPVAIVRGYVYPRPAEDEPDPGVGPLIRQATFDLFR